MSFCPQCQTISPLVIMGACLEAANRFYKCSTCWMLSSHSVYLDTANCNLQTTCYFDVVLVLKWCLEIWKGISPSCFSVCSYRQNQSVMLWKWLLWFDKHVERKIECSKQGWWLKMIVTMMMIIIVKVMMRVITDCGGGWEEKQLLTFQSELSAKLSKADLMPVDKPSAGGSKLKAPVLPPLTEKRGQEERNNDWDEKSGLKERSQSLRVWRRDKKMARKIKTQAAKKQPLSRTPLWKPLLSQNPPFWSYSTYITRLWSYTRRASKPPPPSSLETTFPNPWMLGWRIVHPPVWAVII